MRSYKVITANPTLLIELTEVKSHLKVDVDADDSLITNLIKAATSSCQEYTNRFFLSTELKQYSNSWDGISELFKSPVSSITAIKYYDNLNNQITLDASIYSLNSTIMPSRIETKVDQSFPTVTERWDAVEVNYHVGAGDVSDVDQGIKQAVLLTIGHWYANRETVVVGRIATEIPMAAKYLLDQYKIQVIR